MNQIKESWIKIDQTIKKTTIFLTNDCVQDKSLLKIVHKLKPSNFSPKCLII